MTNVAVTNEIESIVGPLVQRGAIRILKVSWIRDFKGDRLPSRQVLEENHPEAFIDVEDEWALCQTHVLSHMWLSLEHPDPNKYTLSLVQKFLRKPDFRTGLFWDYGSLYQKPRTREQDDTFREGLQAIPYLFMHPTVSILKMMQLPRESPDLAGHAAIPYMKRGWCFAENAWSMLFRPKNLFVHEYTSDSWTEVTDGRIHLSPETFEKMAREDLSFSTEKYDYEVVTKLYRDSFTHFSLSQDVLWLGESYEWDDNQGKALGQMMKDKYYPKLAHLTITESQVTHSFCEPLADGIPFTRLIHLNLNFNKIGDRGVCILAPHLVRMRRVYLDGVGMTVRACQALHQSFGGIYEEISRRELKDQWYEQGCILRWHMSFNTIGDDGLALLQQILEGTKELQVNSCSLTDKSCRFLAEALPWLESVDVGGNRISSQESFVFFAQEAKHLRKVCCGENPFSATGQATESLHELCTKQSLEISWEKGFGSSVM